MDADKGTKFVDLFYVNWGILSLKLIHPNNTYILKL
jgi:hypothetical protein